MTGIVVNFVCSRQTAFGIRVLFSVFEGWKLPPPQKKKNFVIITASI